MDNSVFSVCASNMTMYDLWHNRLGRVIFESMNYMSRLDVILMCEYDKHKCSIRMLNKITRTPLKNDFHSDLCDFHITQDFFIYISYNLMIKL